LTGARSFPHGPFLLEKLDLLEHPGGAVFSCRGLDVLSTKGIT